MAHLTIITNDFNSLYFLLLYPLYSPGLSVLETKREMFSLLRDATVLGAEIATWPSSMSLASGKQAKIKVPC